jgi:glycosyltransferase involved in cell wall biosynthesis
MSTENIRDAAASDTASGDTAGMGETGVAATHTDSTTALMALERISAIVPARNEEQSIAACIDSLLAQPEVIEILVVDDQSSDRTAEIVRERISAEQSLNAEACLDAGTHLNEQPRLKMLATGGVPQGWVGKNNAAAEGAKVASQAWLLFMDADAELLPGACTRAREIANESGAGLISFSPEQITLKWYEKALIPFIYCRLAKKFSYDAVNNPKSRVAAANGQFLMMHRSVYDAIGGHASVAGEVLEDVAIAKRVKAAGYGVRFGSGAGVVRTRMYRSFGAMWKGWEKNLYQLIGGTPAAFRDELSAILPVIPFLLILFGLRYPLAIFAGVILLLVRQLGYGTDLTRNHYPFRFIIYYVPAVLLYAGVLIASYRGHAKGKLAWKGRDVAVGPAGKLS